MARPVRRASGDPQQPSRVSGSRFEKTVNLACRLR